MSIRLRIVVAAGLCAIVGLAGTAKAEMVAPPQADQKVTVVGCASGGIPEFCIMLKADAQAYNVTGARPGLPIGKLVRMTGDGHGPAEPVRRRRARRHQVDRGERHVPEVAG